MNWHQQQAVKRDKVPLWSSTLYTVVIDKPTCLSLIRCEFLSEAITLAENSGGYILRPGGGIEHRKTEREE